MLNESRFPPICLSIFPLLCTPRAVYLKPCYVKWCRWLTKRGTETLEQQKKKIVSRIVPEANSQSHKFFGIWWKQFYFIVFRILYCGFTTLAVFIINQLLFSDRAKKMTWLTTRICLSKLISNKVSTEDSQEHHTNCSLSSQLTLFVYHALDILQTEVQFQHISRF